MIIYDDIIYDHDKEDNDNDNVLKLKDPDVHIVERAVDKRTMVSIACHLLNISPYSYYHAPTPHSDVIQESVGSFTVELHKSLRKGSCPVEILPLM